MTHPIFSRHPRKFTKRTYGRIFVQKIEDIAKVEQIIMEISEFEAGYLPYNFIGVFDPNKEQEFELVCVEKFEMDINELTFTCAKQGIWIWCVDGMI